MNKVNKLFGIGILVCVPFLTAALDADLSVAEQAVSTFYNNLKILSTGEEGDVSYEAGENCINMAASSEVGLFFPNEFKKLGIVGSHDETSLICKSYVSQFKRMASTHNMQFTYQIKNTVPFYEAEWNKGDQKASFVYCIVEKRYGPSIYEGVIRDTVLINSDRKIIGIRNWAGGEAYTNFQATEVTPPSVGPSVQVPSVDLIQLQLNATRYYSAKLYDKAYRTYQAILEHDAENSNAYYRLALMSYRRQGCKQYTKKQTDKYAMDYIYKAFNYGDAELKHKINNILYYW